MITEPKKNRSILYVVNDASFFKSHRLPIALAMKERGWTVTVACAKDEPALSLLKLGLNFVEIPISRSGSRPTEEARTLLSIFKVLNRGRYDLVHTITIKPAIYVGLASRLLRGHRLVHAISGLGSVFTSIKRFRIKEKIAILLYRMAISKRSLLIFQNTTDMNFFISKGIASESNVKLIDGSGVDLDLYQAKEELDGRPVVVVPSRMLWDKGIGEFVEAARTLRKEGLQARFVLLGNTDPGNPSAITKEQLEAWSKEEAVEWEPYTPKIHEYLAKCHVVVLPSYREGLPKTLVDAAACARAVVTTDVPGCRDAIEPGKTGILVPARDVPSLASAIRTLIDDASLRTAMGQAGREMALRRFSIKDIVLAHLVIYGLA